VGLSSCAALKLAETGLFFKPVQFHLQPAYLTIETLWLLMLHRWFWTALAFEKLFGIRLDGLLPLTNLNEGLPKNRTILNESLRRELGNKEAFYHETKTLLSRANHSCGKAA